MWDRAKAGRIASGFVVVAMTASTQAAIEFQDDFENRLAGETPAAQVGSYTSGGFNAPVVVTAGVGTNGAGTTHAASPTLGDTQLLVLDRTGGRNIRRLYGLLDESAVTAGDTVRFTFDANVYAGELGFGLSNNADTDALDFNPLRSSILVYLLPDGTLAARNEHVEPDVARQAIDGVSHPIGQWQTYTIEYVIGESSFSLAVGATTLTIDYLSSDAPSIPRLDGFFFSAGSNLTTSYLDNLIVEVTPVPEPAALAFASFVGLAALVRRR